jgi:hypothetical protein
MTERQNFALANPVDPDNVQAQSRFAQNIIGEHQSYGTVLNVERKDSFWWHAGVTVLSRNLKPIPHLALSNLQRKAAERQARDLLKDVGLPDSEELRWGQKSLHLLRKLTGEEEHRAGGIAQDGAAHSH